MARIQEQVAERLRRRIMDGRYAMHARLPAERDLADELQVSRMTLRKALAVLEAEGRIWRHVGQGTFVGSNAPAGVRSALLGQMYAAPQELLDACIVLEPAVAAQAAMSAHAADIEKMRSCLAKREAAVEPLLYELWDLALHRAIAEATHNPILVSLVKELNALKQTPEWKAHRGNTMTGARHRESKTFHRNIVQAIADRDPQRAYESMRVMMATIEKYVGATMPAVVAG
jgi:DNA-binding FadR family transcriptional regulator